MEIFTSFPRIFHSKLKIYNNITLLNIKVCIKISLKSSISLILMENSWKTYGKPVENFQNKSLLMLFYQKKFLVAKYLRLKTISSV